MARKAKVAFEEKLSAVMDYLEGRKNQGQIASEYDVVQEVQKLVDAGFQYERALAIINAIANYSNHERNGTSCQNK
jgi:elongation factor P hydroxylase